MDFAEFAPATVNGRGNQLSAAHGGDEQLIVSFYMESVLQGAASEEAGRPIYKDVPYVWIRFPGNRNTEVKKKADLKGRNGIPDPLRFPRQWAAFQNGQAEVHEGTPLEQWGPMSKSLALTYKGANVHTVEQLASVHDNSLHTLGHGAREMRDKAITWLKTSKDSAEALHLAAENKRLTDDLDALKAQVAELSKKRRGRPPNVTETDEDD